MYINIGEEKVINEKNIITIINLENINEIDSYIEKISLKNKIIDISKDNRKSLILMNNNIVYITNVLWATLEKRSLKYERMEKK